MIVGIEEVPGAVLDANRNAVINRIVNARYYTGRAEEILPKLLDSQDKLYADYLYKDDLGNAVKSSFWIPLAAAAPRVFWKPSPPFSPTASCTSPATPAPWLETSKSCSKTAMYLKKPPPSKCSPGRCMWRHAVSYESETQSKLE